MWSLRYITVSRSGKKHLEKPKGHKHIQFSDTSNLTGLIQEIERITQLGVAGISGSADLLKGFTVRINQGLDRYCYLALMGDGKWQVDDTGAADLPIGISNLVSGQQDYSFASDVLTVSKVLVKDTAGNWNELVPVDIQENNRASKSIWELPSNNAGVPRHYDKFANSVFLDPIPNYASTGGLKVVFSRNFTKFVSGDTTATPGIPSIFHPYLALYGSYPFLRDNGKANIRDVQMDILRLEDAITEFYSKRTKDEPQRLVPKTRRSSR